VDSLLNTLCGQGRALVVGSAAVLLGSACASAPPESSCAVPPETVISDFEAGLGSVAIEQGRGSSGWYIYNDGEGRQVPQDGRVFASEGGACNTRFALRTQGDGFTVWGAGIGADIAVDSNNLKTTYDASAYQGVVFWARAHGDSTKNIRLKVQDVNTTPEGGICGGAAGPCDDNFGAAIELKGSWERYRVAFDDMKQEGWGKVEVGGSPVTRIREDAVIGIQFQAPLNADFDFSVDEISFY